VYREAKRFGIRGKVWNQNGDVVILAWGEGFNDFLESVKGNPPVGSYIESVAVAPYEAESGLFVADDFVIGESFGGAQDELRFFPPDVSLCERCKGEILVGLKADSSTGDNLSTPDRRAGHYFNNCVTCGPRFSVLKAFPYDRVNTSMSAFPMCDSCLEEYNSPNDRRFHAETICCNDCGPVLHYRKSTAMVAESSATSQGENKNNPFAEALKDLPSGIAIKGIGGYHLACNPFDFAAVRHLRRLKARESKPFALMFRDMAAIKHICEVSSQEEALLVSPARPIVLLKMKHNPFPHEVLGGADGRCGCFLPYTPLQELLFAHSKMPCLVMTSANLSAMPMITKESDIFSLSDRVLYHHREIIRGIEDSVVEVSAGKTCFIRRGRGYVPLPISLPSNIQLLATGGDLKATFGVLKSQGFIQSQPFGDLEYEAALRQFEEGIKDFKALFAIKPELIVCDAHPRYFSSIIAKELAQAQGIPLVPVYHHHAHIGSVMAEHRLSRVLGIAMDGAGYGEDGNIWGGEFLVCEEKLCRRAGHLAYTKVVGADSTAKDCAKTAECYLYANGLPHRHPDHYIIEAALKHNINSYFTSSMGRLFDAVAALTGICDTNSYEGECALRLQYKAEEEEKAKTPPLEMSFDIKHESGMHICHFRDILQKCQAGAPGAALGFHNAVSAMITDVCAKICADENIQDIALSGGVFQNAFLLEKVNADIVARGYNVFTNESVPPNDSGIALGQAFIGVQSIAN